MNEGTSPAPYEPLVHRPNWALYEEKNALRAEARAYLKAISISEHRERSHQLFARLREMPALRYAKSALLFAPLPIEPDINLLWTLGSVADKRCAYPRVEGRNTRLYYVHSLAELKPSRWGIDEPSLLAGREANVQDFDVILVPGLVFDQRGARLGRGGGFYDRLLAEKSPRTTVVGCCFALQRAPKILPTAPHDILMDFVCTDEGLLM